MNAAALTKASLESAIQAAVEQAQNEKSGGDYVAPRRRKLPPDIVIKALCCMGGNSLDKEIADNPVIKHVSKSSFSEARSRFSAMTVADALTRFNAQENQNASTQYKGYHLVGVDGVHFRTALNPHSASYQPAGNFNEYLCVVYLNLLSHIPLSVALACRPDELGTASGSLAFTPPSTPTIIVGDRLYSGYSFISDLQNTPNADFVIRSKNGTGAMKAIRELPMKELDTDIQVILTDSQSKASKEAGHIYINKGSKRGKANSLKTYVSRFAYPLPYVMNLRVVRVKLPTGQLETLISSLPRELFSAAELCRIYAARWNIELYFRHIKHDCACSNMHSKVEDYSVQQIFTTFLFSSAVWKIINAVAIQQRESNTYEYAVNVKMATYLIRDFLRDPNGDSEKLLNQLTRYVVPIRPDRSAERRIVTKSFVPFAYRVA